MIFGENSMQLAMFNAELQKHGIVRLEYSVHGAYTEFARVDDQNTVRVSDRIIVGLGTYVDLIEYIVDQFAVGYDQPDDVWALAQLT